MTLFVGVLRITKSAQSAIRQSPNRIEHQLRLAEVAGERRAFHWIDEKRRNGEPKESSPLGRTSNERMVDEFHQPLASRFVSRLHQNRPDRMDAEGVLVPLLFLDEVVVSAKLPKHVGQDHRAAVGLVEEVGEPPIFRAVP